MTIRRENHNSFGSQLSLLCLLDRQVNHRPFSMAAALKRFVLLFSICVVTACGDSRGSSGGGVPQSSNNTGGTTQGIVVANDHSSFDLLTFKLRPATSSTDFALIPDLITGLPGPGSLTNVPVSLLPGSYDIGVGFNGPVFFKTVKNVFLQPNDEVSVDLDGNGNLSVLVNSRPTTGSIRIENNSGGTFIRLSLRPSTSPFFGDLNTQQDAVRVGNTGLTPTGGSRVFGNIAPGTYDLFAEVINVGGQPGNSVTYVDTPLVVSAGVDLTLTLN